MVIFLERFHEQIVDGKPNRPAPVRISAEEAGSGFGWLVLNAVCHSIHTYFVRMFLVVARKGAHAARRTLRHVDMFWHFGMIVYEPLHAALEARKTIDDLRLEGLDRK